MQEIKSEQLQYYCNSIGEIHECGKRMLDSVDELPQPLQRPYQEFWTDEWSLCCYIVFLNEQPGILLCAEYDDDYCQSQGIPIEYDAQYAVLYRYGERLEKLACEINPHVIAGLSYNDSTSPQVLLFIPTEHVPTQDIPKLYYLMDQYGFQRAPDRVHWTVQELTEFIKRLRLTPEVESQMLSSLDSDVELGTPDRDGESVLRYMGLEINKSDLYGRDELLGMLDKCGGCDSSLDKVCDTYTERFGNQLIWKYPFSDNMQGGGVIVPVQEGFLFLPYHCVYEQAGAQYQLRSAELLSTENIRTLQNECRAYVRGLLSALDDMEHTMQSYPARRYVDARGNLYFVRAGLGDVYKGFRRYADPKPGQRRESGIRSLRYVPDFCRAQLDLDQYAKEHRLQQLEAGDDARGTGQNG